MIKDFLIKIYNRKIWIPKLKKLEFLVSYKFYDSFNEYDLYEKIWSGFSESSNEKFETINECMKIFDALPLNEKIFHVLDIREYYDSCTTYEEYMGEANYRKSIVFNFLLLNYSKIIITQLQQNEKKSFIEIIKDRVRELHFHENKYETVFLNSMDFDDCFNNSNKSKIIKI